MKMQILTRIHPGEVALSFLHFPDPNLRKVMHACPRTAHTHKHARVWACLCRKFRLLEGGPVMLPVEPKARRLRMLL